MTMLPTDEVSQNADDCLIAQFEAGLAHGDGEASRSHLQADRAVHYVEETTPSGHVIREHPSGDREVLGVDVDCITYVISGI